MVEPISAAVVAGKTLLKALGTVKDLCQKKRNNDKIVQELSTFITNLDVDLASLKQRTPRSNSALWAAGALKVHLDRAADYVQDCLDRGYIKSFWSVNIIYHKLKRIREGLATSFQTKLQIIIFDVVIQEQSKQEEFRANLSRVQGALTDALEDSAVVRKEWKDELHHVNASIRDLREELKALVQPVLDGMGARQDLDTAIALTRSTEPQTSESEKFFADVLANLEGLRDRPEGQTSAAAEDDAEERWFEDPITAQVMCDPIKCSDGRTYDRWTVLDHHMVLSPFDNSLEGFGIVVDDINVRARLFKMFPQQEAVFHARRLRHRNEALEHAREGEYGDALEKLDQVLQWARSDRGCKSRRDGIHHLLEGLQITLPGSSNMKPYKSSAVSAMADPEPKPEPPLLLPAALVELLDSLESLTPSLSELPPPDPASCWGTYFVDGEHEAMGESRGKLRLRIMTAIGNCRSLRTILLQSNASRVHSATEVEATALLKGLKHNPVLKSLSLVRFQGFGTTEACIALAAAVLRPGSRLEELDMRGIGLSVEGLGHISAALRDNSSSSLLRALQLGANDIGNVAGARHIAAILTHSPAIQTLGLRGIGMDDAGAVVIAEAVARSTTLVDLRIGYSRKENLEQVAMLIPLLTALSRGVSSSLPQSHSASSFNQSITKLWLEVGGLARWAVRDIILEGELAEAVAGMLRNNATLLDLTVTSFFVTHGLRALPHNNSIRALRLWHFYSPDEEKLDPLLMTILRECTKLERLQLSFAKPYGRSNFTKELFHWLKHNNPCVKTLVLDYWDGLDDDMFEDLIQSLSTNTNLEHISIRGTSWEKQGKGERLLKTLRDTRVKPALAALLAELESDSPVLQQLPSEDLWGSYFDCMCQDEECEHRFDWQWDVRLRLMTAIGRCRTLRKINLNPEVVSDPGSVREVEALALLSGLQDNLVLQELDLYGYKGFGTTAACQALTAVIHSSYSSLHFLGMQYVGLSAQGLGDIAPAIRGNGSSVLSSLALCGNDIGNAVGAQHLADILTNAPSLTDVMVTDIVMGEEGSGLIAEALAHTTTLTVLTIGATELRYLQMEATFFIPLLEALVWPDDFVWGPIKTKGGLMKRLLKKWTGRGKHDFRDTATSISSSGTHSPGSDAQNSPTAFNHSITTLNIMWPGGPRAVELGRGLEDAWARVIRSNRALNHLVLGSFFVTRGLGALPESNSINKLDVIHECNSNDDDMDPMLITILEECKTVQELTLTFLAPFGPSRFTKAFFQGLQNNRNLKTLVLDGWNGLDDDMFQDLMTSLGPNSNSVLENISIKETSWEVEGKGKRIQNALIQNRRRR